MLTISRQSDYACRILLHLAVLPAGARVTAAEIAEQRLIPPAMIRRIVTDLGVTGLIKTTRGNNGGISLGRPAGEISLLEVVQAVDGPVALNPCTIAPRNDPDSCPFIPTCPVHDAWMQVRVTLMRELGQITFDKLAEQGLASGPVLIKEE